MLFNAESEMRRSTLIGNSVLRYMEGKILGRRKSLMLNIEFHTSFYVDVGNTGERLIMLFDEWFLK